MSCEKESPSFGCVKDRMRMFESKKEIVSAPIINRVSKPFMEKRETRAEPVRSVSKPQQNIQTGRDTGFHSFSDENSGEKTQMSSRPFLVDINPSILEKQENFKSRNEMFAPVVKSDDVKKTNVKRNHPPPPPPRSCQVIKNIQESNDDVFINTTVVSNNSKMLESQSMSSVLEPPVIMVDKNVEESYNDVFINKTSVSNSHQMDYQLLPPVLPPPEMETVKNVEKSKENTSTNIALVCNNHQMMTGLPLPRILPPPPPIVRERIIKNQDSFSISPSPFINSKASNSTELNDQNFSFSSKKRGSDYIPPSISSEKEQNKIFNDPVLIASSKLDSAAPSLPVAVPLRKSISNEVEMPRNNVIASSKLDSAAPSLPVAVPVRKSISNEVEMPRNNVIAPSLPPPPSTKVSKTSNVLLGWVKPPSVEKLAPVIQNPPKMVEDKVLKNAEVGKPPPIVVAPPSLESVRKIKEQASSRSSDGSIEETHEKEDAFKRESWFFDVSKREASLIMKRPMKKGTFLMRPSENNQFVLMVRMESLEVRKFKIQRYKQGWILGDQSDLKQIHANLLKLMEHYRTNGIKVGSTTLILEEPVPKNK